MGSAEAKAALNVATQQPAAEDDVYNEDKSCIINLFAASC